MRTLSLGDGKFGAKEDNDQKLEFDGQVPELRGEWQTDEEPDVPPHLKDSGRGEGGWIPKGDAISLGTRAHGGWVASKESRLSSTKEEACGKPQRRPSVSSLRL